jgi:hypothetical protein
MPAWDMMLGLNVQLQFGTDIIISKSGLNSV